MNHDEWKENRCDIFDFDCTECMTKRCLDDPEYNDE